jgi:hypothetical protein
VERLVDEGQQLDQLTYGSAITAPLHPGVLAQAEPAPAMFGRIMGNLDFFLGHGAGPLSSYVPDIAALRAGPVRVVAGVGASSAGQLAHRGAVALAERLGTDPVSFPGDHSGFTSLPEAFAQALDMVLRG